MQGVPPPFVHIHFSILDVSKLPIGKLLAGTGSLATGDATDEEKKVFDEWTRQRWRKKDDMLDRFYRDGDFVGGAHTRSVAARAKDAKADHSTTEFAEIPVKLRSNMEFFDMFSGLVPITVAIVATRFYKTLTGSA